jgi:hypothetical protein
MPPTPTRTTIHSPPLTLHRSLPTYLRGKTITGKSAHRSDRQLADPSHYPQKNFQMENNYREHIIYSSFGGQS